MCYFAIVQSFCPAPEPYFGFVACAQLFFTLASWEDGQYYSFYYTSWIQTKQSKMSLSIQPIQMRNFLVVTHSLSFNFHLLKQNINISNSVCLSKGATGGRGLPKGQFNSECTNKCRFLYIMWLQTHNSANLILDKLECTRAIACSAPYLVKVKQSRGYRQRPQAPAKNQQWLTYKDRQQKNRSSVSLQSKHKIQGNMLHL